MKKTVLIVLCVVFVVGLFGCGTIKGIGDDIAAVGGWLKKSSDTVQDKTNDK